MDTATVFTNYTCNQHCGFCTFRRPQDERGFTALPRIRGEIRAAAAQGAKTLVISGGEPTLDPRLPGHVRAAREAGIEEVILETNAMILAYPGRAEALVEAGLTTARVALNAPAAEASDAITEVAGAFELTLRGAERAAAAGLRVELGTALTTANLRDAVELPAFCAARLPAVRRIVVRAVVDADDALVPRYGDVADAVTEMTEAAREAGIELRFDPRYSIPLCLFPARRRYPELFAVGAPHVAQGFSRVSACETCVARELCPGIQQRYLDLHGEAGIEPVPARETRFVRGLGGDRRELVEKELISDSICYTGGDGGARRERVIRINFHCNQDCPFCFVNRDLPAQDPSRIRDEIARAAEDGVGLLSLSGGEPTLNPSLPDYIRQASELGLLVQIQTNAIRCARPGYALSLREAGLVRAFVSLHGATAAVSDTVTRARGTFERTLTGVGELVAAGVHVSLNCVITGENYRELPELVALIHREWGTAPELTLSYANASTDSRAGERRDHASLRGGAPLRRRSDPDGAESGPGLQRAGRRVRSAALLPRARLARRHPAGGAAGAEPRARLPEAGGVW